MALHGGVRMMNQIFTWLGKSKKATGDSYNNEKVPQHIAIIMDGNGRWANRLGLPRAAGHHAGMKNVKKITIAANDMGVKVLTLYAFSTENWKRPKEEVDYLMKLPHEFFIKEIDELMKENVKIHMMGYKDSLPDFTLKPIEEAIQRTKNNTGLILNFAMNYGSRKEIIQGFKLMMKDIEDGVLNSEEVTEKQFNQYLLSRFISDPDLLIRTSGEYRISNFMLWQLAYTELWFTEVFWPDFTEDHLKSAIMEYQKRVRRYGSV